MIRLTRLGVEADAEEIARCRHDFDRQHWVKLPQLLEPSLLAFVLDGLDSVGWTEVSEDFYAEAQPLDGPAMHLLMFLANSPGFLDLAQGLTGCGPFSWFDGRVYRMTPAGGHHDNWHSDWGGGRRVALSLNLSRAPYEGGDLHLRSVQQPETPVEVTNPQAGDAILFRLGEDLVHRVSRVTGTQSKTAFAGWFNDAELSLLDRLHAVRPPG